MILRFIHNRRGTAATEFVLALPMMLALLFGAMEAGHFFWTQHKIVKSVRDGARFASRLDVEQLCPKPSNATLVGDIQNLTATGSFDGGAPKVPGWDPGTVVVEIGCGEDGEGFVETGIYSDLGTAGPMVRVSSGPVIYPSILGSLGFIDDTISLSAQSSTAVMGI